MSLKIFGEDLDTLRSSAERLRAGCNRFPVSSTCRWKSRCSIPQLKVTPDYERAALYGITPAALTEASEALAGGRVVSQIVEGNRRFDVVMRISDDNRSTTGLQDLLIATPQGFVPLRLLARGGRGRRPQPDPARERAAPHRRACQRRRQRDMAAIVADIRRVMAETHLPQATPLSSKAPSRAQEERRCIGVLSLVSLALIFMVLYSGYQSTVLALIILTNIPLALIGSVHRA